MNESCHAGACLNNSSVCSKSFVGGKIRKPDGHGLFKKLRSEDREYANVSLFYDKSLEECGVQGFRKLAVNGNISG